MAAIKMKKNKVLITTSKFAEFDHSPLKLLEDNSFEYLLNPLERKLTKSEFIDLQPGFNCVLAGLETLDEEVFNKSHLEVISRVGTGMNNIDQQSAKNHNIAVYNTPLGPMQSVAEITVGALLSLLRKIPQANNALHNKKWNKLFGNLLYKKEILFIGYGNIARKVHDLIRPYEVNVSIFDPFVNAEIFKDVKYYKNLSDALPKVDIISIHTSSAEEILSAKEFNLMKDGVYILNAARGEIINEQSLEIFLKNKKVAGAWLDVFWEEPYKGNLVDYSNVILTPHIGSYSYEGRISMETAAVENLINHFKK